MIVTSSSLPVHVHAENVINGFVVDEAGDPLEGAVVVAWEGISKINSVETDADGWFEVEVGDGLYSVTVFADEIDTPGVDYLPARAGPVSPNAKDQRALWSSTPKVVPVRTGLEGGLFFQLIPAASLIIEEDIQMVESENLPISNFFMVTGEGGKVLSPSGLPLIYGSTEGDATKATGLEPSHLVVPAGRRFGIVVNSTILLGSTLVNRTFIIEPDTPLAKGERSSVDVRLFSIPFNIEIISDMGLQTGQRVEEMESLGFYLTKQRGRASSALILLEEARELFRSESFYESYDQARRSFIEYRHTLKELESMYTDASLSTYILVSFLAVTAITIGYLLTYRVTTRIPVTVGLYTVALSALYVIYPGCSIIPRLYFIGSAILALVAIYGFTLLLPRLLKGGARDDHIPVRNMLVPIFSIAKRSLLRRRLRFLLTLVSLTVLVMSFVSLTSLSEGYGLVTTRVSRKQTAAEGVLIRSMEWTPYNPVALMMSGIEYEWLERQPESVVVSPRIESMPLYSSFFSINDVPLRGVIGIDPEREAAIIGIDSLLVEGTLPDEKGVLVSAELKARLGAEIGDILSLGANWVVLQGVLDDDGLADLTDLDGEPYLPKKWQNVSLEGTDPVWVLEPSEPHEVVVTQPSIATNLPFVSVQRISFKVVEDINPDDFAERLALEKGYVAYSSTADGIIATRLGSYLEGKGLPLMVPWIIVVLNVVVTMLNSLFERRKEIETLSSVGLNPAQISAIFVAEAMITGFIAGGMGYLVGLSIYKGMAYFRLTLEVHQKISAFWSLASIGLAISAVLTGAFAALKSSVVITPSLMRRWRIDRRGGGFWDPWEITIPVRFEHGEVDGFKEFLLSYLRGMLDDPVRSTASIKVSEEDGVKRIDFIYKSTQASMGNFYTRNTIIMEQGPDGLYTAKLRSLGDHEGSHNVGSMVRMRVMEWSTLQGKPGD